MRFESRQLVERLDALQYTGDGSIAFLIRKPAPGVHEPVDSQELIPGRGFADDHPRKSYWKGRDVPGREITAVGLEVLREMRLAPDVPGDNLVTSGIDLSALKPGDRLISGDVVLQRSDRTHRPCALFRSRAGDAVFEAAASGYRGALVVVVAGGRLEIGDPLRLERSQPRGAVVDGPVVSTKVSGSHG
jgi:hypothetical protein